MQIMKSKFFIYLLIGCLIGALLVPSISSYEPVSFGTIWVDDDAAPSWYDATHVKTIQEGVDNASVGDTIYVWAGTYYENVSIGKTVTLIGNGTGISFVDRGIGPLFMLNIFDVNADSVNISGFSINDGWYGINISSVKNCNISNNYIYGNWHGIYLSSGSSDNIISGNKCSSNYGFGIYLNSSSNNNITGNNASDNDRNGIHLTNSNDNVIISNNASDNWHGIYLTNSNDNVIISNHALLNSHYGIYLNDSQDNTIKGNNIKYHTGFRKGISLSSSSYNIISGNNCSSNGYGIYLSSSSNNNITGNNASDSRMSGIDLHFSNSNNIVNNTIKNNLYNGIFLMSSSSNNIITGNNISDNPYNGIELYDSSNHNIIYNNYFDNPLTNALDYCINNWNITKTLGTNIIGGPYLGGNYWSDYTGIDTDGDALGDTLIPYNTSITNGGDYHPLVFNSAPIANFTYTPTFPTDLDTISFTDTSIDLGGSIVNWSWDFGDGNSSFDQHPTHQYGDDGIYTVCLTVKDDDDAVDTYCTVITVLNVPPVADANGPYKEIVHEPVQFDGSGSYDPDGTIISYEWNFGDGNYGTGMITDHTYDRVGSYTVILNVTDDDGSWDTDTTTACCLPDPSEDPPTVVLIYPEGGETLKGTVTVEWWALDTQDEYDMPIYLYYDNIWNQINGILENTGEYLWDTTTLPDGTYTLLVEAVDSDGNGGQDESDPFLIKNHEDPIENLPPNKPFKPSGESSGKTGDEYSYQSSTSDPDGDQIYYKWDWGDETSGWLGPYDGGVTITTPHVWDEDGEYTVRVKAKDVYGEESDWSDPLVVSMPKSKTITPFGTIIVFGFDVDVKIVQLEPGEDYVDLEVLSKPFYIWENGIETRNPGEFIRLYNAKGLFSPSLPLCFGICDDWGIIG